MTPLPPATIIPIGPFKLSTHPGSGSWYAGVTINQNIITTLMCHLIYDNYCFIYAMICARLTEQKLDNCDSQTFSINSNC